MRKAKHDAMLKAFDAFAKRIANRYAEAREHLEREEYEDAQIILARLSTSHAKTSLSLRNFLIREGIIKEEDK